MHPLRIPRHEKFAQLLAAGDTQVAAYRLAYRYNGSHRNAQKLAYRLATRPDLSARVAHLQKLAAKKLNWDLAQRLAFLRDSTLTPPADIDAHSPLCLGTRLTSHGQELKYIDKLRAIELYSKLAGDFTPQPEAAPPTPLGELIDRIRARPPSAT